MVLLISPWLDFGGSQFGVQSCLLIGYDYTPGTNTRNTPFFMDCFHLSQRHDSSPFYRIPGLPPLTCDGEPQPAQMATFGREARKVSGSLHVSPDSNPLTLYFLATFKTSNCSMMLVVVL